MSAIEIHRKLNSTRERANKDGPNITSVCRARKGATFKWARKETRGRQRILTKANLYAFDRPRKRWVRKLKGKSEIRCDDIIKAARVPKVNRAMAAKNMEAAGFDIQ